MVRVRNGVKVRKLAVLAGKLLGIAELFMLSFLLTSACHGVCVTIPLRDRVRLIADVADGC